MTDIILGLAIVWCLAAGLFVLALWVGGKVSGRVAALIGVVPAAAIGLHAFVLYDNPRLVWVLPVSSLVVVGNVTPLAVAFLGGLAWRHVPRPLVRKLAIVTPLFAVCVLVAYAGLLGGPPRCVNRVEDKIGLQSSQATGPVSAAATLLRLHGVAATESEMAALCLTRGWGTSRLGLYRGLKLKTASTPWDVELVSWTLEQLRDKPPEPVLILLEREDDATGAPRRQSAWGLVRMLPEVVVFIGFADDEIVDVGDPAVGREQWNVRNIRKAWQGLAFRLVRRSPAQPTEAAAAPSTAPATRLDQGEPLPASRQEP